MTSKEWKEYKLESISSLISRGITPKYTNSCDCIVLNQKCIRGGTISYKNARKTDNIAKPFNPIKYVKRTDTLICSTGIGTLGRVGRFKNEYNNFTTVDSHITIVRSNKNVDPMFLNYNLFGRQAEIEALAEGTTGQTELPKKKLEQVIIQLPPLETQQKIAKVLSAIDNKIELNNSINNNLEQQAMALFTYNFIDNSNENRISCKAEEYFNISIGKTPPRKEPEWFSDIDGVKWVSISDMGNCGMYISNSSEYLTPSAIDKYNVKIVPDNTVILSFKLTVGRVAITVGEMTTNEAIAHFKTDNKKINEYLYCYLKKFNYQTMGSTSSIATAVNSKIIKAMLFVVPTDDEINKFHTIVKPIFNQIKLNQMENSNLIQLRDTLLPKLMSGEIDVSNVDISADKLYEPANESKLSAEPYNSSGSFASASKNLSSEQSSSADKLLFSEDKLC